MAEGASLFRPTDLSILAHRLGRTVYTMWKTGKPFDKERFMATLN